MEEKKPLLSKPLQLIVFVCFGIILILSSILLKQNFPDYSTIPDLLICLGQALIIGPALSWILDLPSMIDYFRKITIESLISSAYLKSLPRSRLVELRKECTAKIHLKDSESVEKGLINMDENVCELLTQPYYERYRQNTICQADEKYFVKKHHIEEYLINPLGIKTTYDDFPKTYLNIEDGQSVNNIFKVLKLTVKIDDQPESDYTSNVEIKENKINKSDIPFDRELVWYDKKSNSVLAFDYTNSIIINRVTEVRTPKSDITYIKRVKKPVKSLKVDYSYGGHDLKLVGSCFGTLSYSNDGGMKIIQEDNYISIESFNWLLPGNGIFIVKIPTPQV